jgi:hypothetical protein
MLPLRIGPREVCKSHIKRQLEVQVANTRRMPRVTSNDKQVANTRGIVNTKVSMRVVICQCLMGKATSIENHIISTDRKEYHGAFHRSM